METTASPQPSADTAPTGSPVDRTVPFAVILGQTDLARVEQEILTLRCCTDLALREAERLDRAAEARAARLEAAEARLAAMPIAEQHSEAWAADAELVESLQPSGETSLSLHRLTRVVRINIMLEQKLIAALRSPKTEAAPKTGAAPKTEAAPKPRDKAAAEPSRWAKLGQGAELEPRKAAARALTRDSADADERLDREDVEALMAELEAELASGKHDKDLRKEWGNDAAVNFLKARNIKPDYRAMFARARAQIEVVMRGVPSDAATSAELTGQDEPAEAGDSSPATSPRPGDPGWAAVPPRVPSGAGPPQGSG